MFYGQLFAFTPLYLPHLGVTAADIPTWTGAATAISMALGLPFVPLWGALADRYSRQPIIVRSYAVLLGATLLAMLAGNVWVFIVARAMTGFALGNSGLMLANLAERAPQNRQGLAFGLMNSGQPLGAFLGPIVGGPIVDHWGFPTLLLIDSVLLLAVVLGLTLGYRDTFVGSKEGSLLGMSLRSLRLVGTTPRLRALFLAMALILAAWVLPYTYIPLVVTRLYHGNQPGTAVGLVLGASGLATLLLGPFIGSLADRWRVWPVLLTGAAVLVALLPLPALAPELLSLAIAWALVSGVGVGVYAISFSALATSVSTNVRGRVMALAYVPGNLAFILAGAIGSVVANVSLVAVFPAAALIGVVGLAGLIIASRQRALDGGDAIPNPA